MALAVMNADASDGVDPSARAAGLDGLLEPEEVADEALQCLADGRFLCLPFQSCSSLCLLLGTCQRCGATLLLSFPIHGHSELTYDIGW